MWKVSIYTLLVANITKERKQKMNDKKDKAIVIFSGGPDSTAATLWAIDQGFDVELLTFQFFNAESYGEISASIDIARALKLPHKIVDFKSPLHLFRKDIRPMMHAGIREKDPENTAEPYLLPYGSGILLSYTASYAIDKGVKNIVWGATKDDQKDNPSYGDSFANDLADLISKTTGRSVLIHTPLSGKHKFEVITDLNEKSKLFDKTWTCIEEGPIQCGKCVACITRRVAVEISGIKDNTPYVTSSYENPLSSEQMANIRSMSESDRVALLSDMKKTC
jgi:7-cyano-7-deazaguanine synthase